MLPLLLILGCGGPNPGDRPADTATPTTPAGAAPTGATATGTTPPGTPGTGTPGTGTRPTGPDDPPETVPTLHPMFSHASGVYDAPFTLTVDPAFDGAGVVCSTDGSRPAIDGPPCTELRVDRTMVVRATTVDGGFAAVGPHTRTFVLPDTVVTQEPPPTWPDLWWTDDETGPYTADYGMDPEVWDVPGADVEGALGALPVASLVVDVDDLFGPDGIHENPRVGGVAWERAGHFELFTPDGAEALALGCGVRIHGGSGRRPDRSPKKSFRLLFKNEYGPTTLEHPLFPSPPDRFNTLVLRAGYNRVWNNWQADQRVRSQYMRERYAGDLLRDMGHLAPRGRYAHLYLNGLYWGIYLLQERPDAAMQAEHEGGDRADYDAWNSGELVDGDDTAWATLLALSAADLSDPAAYDAVLAVLERDLFIEYTLVNYALGNLDWPEKNWWAGRNRAADGTLRFFTWDTELTLANTTDDVLGEEPPPDSPGWIFHQLTANPDFVRRFGDLAHRHLYAPGALLAAEAQQDRWAALALEVRPALEAESARWGDHWRDDRADPEGELYTPDVHWEVEYARLMDLYFELRHTRFLEHLRLHGLYPPIDAPVPSVDPGAVPAGTVVVLTAPDPVWATTDGTDPRAEDGSVAPAASADPVVVDADTTVLARARADDGTWSALLEATWTVR